MTISSKSRAQKESSPTMHQMLFLLAVCCLTASAVPVPGPYALSQPAMQLLESMGFPSYAMSDIRRETPIRERDSPIYYIKLPPTPLQQNYNIVDPNNPFLTAPIEDDTHNSFYSVEDNVLGQGYPQQYQEESAYVVRTTTTTESPFEQVPVEFTNNGRPEHIYHWSGPTTSLDHFWAYKPSFKPSGTTNAKFPPHQFNTKPTTTTTSTTTTTTTTPKPTTTVRPTTTSRPYYSQYPQTATSWPPKPFKPTSKKPWVSFVKQFSSNGKPSGIYIYKSKPILKTHKYKHPLFRHFNY